ncbi:MAG TPA: zf-HC2 domain-containing protein [Gemmatimonadales bacterium]|nr:zf-HC2 domain-containing protein [Gemmatimonadales bacterium]
MPDRWTDRLSEYLDGELGASDAVALEAHLADCADCRATLAELRRVVLRAGALDDRPPKADLWPGVAARIGRAPGGHAPIRAPGGARLTPRRFSFTVPQLAAAAVALTLLSSGVAWLALRGPVAQPAVQPTAALAVSVPTMTNAVATEGADPRYASAVATLERVLAEHRGRLDTATVRVLEKNLAIIERAIRDAQSALAADPANQYLNLHLAQERRRKLELLRRVAVLAGSQT